MNILITGGSGFIGQNFIKFLIINKKKIINIDLIKSEFKHSNLINYICDYRDAKKINKIFSTQKIDIVFHFASKTTVNDMKYDDLDYFNINSFGITGLLRIMKKNNIRKFFFSSSAAVYGHNDYGKKNYETTDLKPISKYGLSKAFAEKIVSDTCKNLGINFIIARYFNVLGSNIYSKKSTSIKHNSIMYHLKESLFNGKKFYIYGNNLNTKDGTAFRDYIHISDVLNFNYCAMNYLNKNKNSLILNCGLSKSYSVMELLKEFNLIHRAKIKGYKKAHNKNEIIYSKSDTNKTKKLLNWTPSRKSLKELLKV